MGSLKGKNSLPFYPIPFLQMNTFLTLSYNGKPDKKESSKTFWMFRLSEKRSAPLSHCETKKNDDADNDQTNKEMDRIGIRYTLHVCMLCIMYIQPIYKKYFLNADHFFACSLPPVSAKHVCFSNRSQTAFVFFVIIIFSISSTLTAYRAYR